MSTTKTKAIRDGFTIEVKEKDPSGSRYRSGPTVFQKRIKRIPRSFPKELIPYCNM